MRLPGREFQDVVLPSLTENCLWLVFKSEAHEHLMFDDRAN